MKMLYFDWMIRVNYFLTVHLDSCISNSGTEPDYEGKKNVRIMFIYLFFA